jgi:TRAP-type C4-dicarboxylate transport system permease small subunit
MSAVARLVETLSRITGYFAVALIVSSVAVICQMLFVRFILGQSAIWQNEYVTFAIIGATFLGSPYVLLTRGHVNVDLLPIYLGERGRWLLGLLAATLGLLFCAIVFATSIHWWWEAWSFGFTTSTVWRAPLWVPYLSLLLGMALLTLQYAVELWAIATKRKSPFGDHHESFGT